MDIAALAGVLSTVGGAVVALAAGTLARRVTEKDTVDARTRLREVYREVYNAVAIDTEGRRGPVAGDASGDQSEDASARQAMLHLEYHAQGLAQSKTSFYVSLAGATLGFVVVIGSIVFAVVGETDVAVVGLVGGVVTDVVAALFFRESNRARSLMRELFDSLRIDRKNEREFATALNLIDSVEDVVVRDALRGAVSLRLVDGVTDASEAAQWLREALAERATRSRAETPASPRRKRPSARTTAKDSTPPD